MVSSNGVALASYYRPDNAGPPGTVAEVMQVRFLARDILARKMTVGTLACPARIAPLHHNAARPRAISGFQRQRVCACGPSRARPANQHSCWPGFCLPPTCC